MAENFLRVVYNDSSQRMLARVVSGSMRTVLFHDWVRAQTRGVVDLNSVLLRLVW